MERINETAENQPIEKGDLSAAESDVNDRVDSTGGEDDAGTDGFDDGTVDLRQINHPGISDPEVKEPEINEPALPEPEINESEIKEPEIIEPVAPVDETKPPLVGEARETGEKINQIEPVNGRMPINCEFAGKTFPLERLPENIREKYPDSVRFTEQGYPEFSRYASERVQIEYSGDRGIDFTRANKALGFESTPEGYTWHHHEDAKTLELVPTELHKAVRHTGGCATSGLDYD